MLRCAVRRMDLWPEEKTYSGRSVFTKCTIGQYVAYTSIACKNTIVMPADLYLYFHFVMEKGSRDLGLTNGVNDLSRFPGVFSGNDLIKPLLLQSALRQTATFLA